jgi:predicted CXXCH cytochrome family protein
MINMKKIYIMIILLVFIVSYLAYASITSTSGYQPTKSSLIFSHEFHVVEQEIECSSCHVSIESSNQASDKNLPTMDECGNCHDIEDDESCGMCHKDADEPMEIENPIRELIFSHQNHTQMDIDCNQCHSKVNTSSKPNIENLPEMGVCFQCHDNSKASKDCIICHSSGLSLADIHPVSWLYNHESRASSEPDWCAQCHDTQSDCISCHRGDNLIGSIHDLNYFFTHGLDARSNNITCQKCHNNKNFCVTCHEQNMRMPLNHSRINWQTVHGMEAKQDIENCASCHESSDPTCSRAGCHNDFDGIIGTDPPIHELDPIQFDREGSWHEDESYYCFQCHISTPNLNIGFCTYCHSELED